MGRQWEAARLNRAADLHQLAASCAPAVLRGGGVEGGGKEKKEEKEKDMEEEYFCL